MDKTFSIRFWDSNSDNRKSKIQNLKWAGFLATLVLLVGCVEMAEAQQPGKVYRIGYLQTSARERQLHFVKAFEESLRDRGYVVGKNIVIEYRFAEGKPEHLPQLAADLVRLKVDVIVTGVNSNTVVAKEATATIPIVMAFGNDPVGTGLVASLPRPGGNITGLAVDASDEMQGKRVDLLRETVPKLSRVAVLWNMTNAAHSFYLKNLEVPAQHLKVTLLPIGLREASDIESAFNKMAQERAGGLIVLSDGVAFNQRGQIANLALRHRLPVMGPQSDYADAGGLMSYGANLVDNMRRAATYVDKILKGAKPADLPVEQPIKFELVINLKTAKQIGLTIPQSVLYRADKVFK